MATLYPSLLETTRRNGGSWQELQTVELLHRELAQQFSVFHSLDWFCDFATAERHGELDVVVMSPSGDLVV